MLDISYHYKTKRCDFGRPISLLEETNTRVFLSIEPDPDLRAKYESINPFSVGVQASESYSLHQVNTEVTQTKAEDVVHKEGGWPQGIDPTNAPSCKQTRLKIEKREKFVEHLRDLAVPAEKTAKLNVAIDLFSDHFASTENPTSVVDPSMRTISIFRDRYENRQVSSISWSSDTSLVKRVALCYTPNDLSCPSAHYESFIYNLECPSVPETTLHPPSALMCLEYNAKDNNFLVGGMSHGSLSLWDVRQGSLPVWTSAIESSHRDAVYAVKWISSKTAFECVSVSSDGTSMTWDTRSNTSPLETINLAPAPEALPEGFTPPFGGRCLDYHTGVPTKFMVGTVEGLVMTVNRKSSDPNNRISGVFPGHYGPVYAVRRHPTDTKYFCSVSDWCARFFTEDNKTPLLTIPAQRNYLTNAVWGLSRTTVVYTGNVCGGIDAWDLIQSLKEPVCSISVGANPVYSMAVEGTGQFLLTGDSVGTATLLELNEPLRNISQTERSLFNGMMGRESKRVKNYDQFLKEQKMREKAKQNTQAVDTEAKKDDKFDPAAIEAEFDAALRGEAEKVVEKKRVVIGEEEPQPGATEEAPQGGDQDKGIIGNVAAGMAEALGGEEEKKEEPPVEEPKKEEPKKEEPKKEEPPPEEPKKEEPPAEEPKKEEPPAEEPKKEEEEKKEEPANPLANLAAGIAGAIGGEEEKKEEPPAEEPPAEETPAAEEPPAEEAPAAEEPPAEEAPAAEEPPAEETPAAEEPPAEEAPAAEEPPAEEENKEEAQAEEGNVETREVGGEPEAEAPAEEEKKEEGGENLLGNIANAIGGALVGDD